MANQDSFPIFPISALQTKYTDIYHRWVAWSEDDQAYIGRCPDLFQGGVHGDDPIKVARKLEQVIDEWEVILGQSKRPLPAARVKPTVEFV